MHGKDGEGLKLEKLRTIFSSLNATPTRIIKNIIILWLVLPDEIFLYLHNSIGIFCLSVKAVSNDSSTELT